MMRLPSGVKPLPRLPSLPAAAFTEPEQRKAIERFNDLVAEWFEQVNGRLSLGDTLGAWSGHIDGERLLVTVTASGTAFPVAHNLERVPVGYIVTKNGSAGFVLAQTDTTPAATDALIWFFTSAAVGIQYELLIF